MDEFKFRYYVYFIKNASDLMINILLRLGDDTMSVYYRHYDVAILDNKEYFMIAYNEFKEYLQNTNIIMNKKDLLFLNEQLQKHHLEFPKVYTITLDDFTIEPEKYVNELTSKEILFLMFINGKRVADKRFEDWEKEYHLNVAYLTKSLLEAGYITKNDYRKNMNKAKRSLLRTVMDTYGLEGFGDNNELIEIILENLTEDQLKEYFNGTHYFLTPKGEQVVSKNRKLEDYSRSYYRHVDNMRLEEFHLLSIKRPNYNFQAICRLLIQNNESSQKEYVDWDQFIDDVLHDRVPKTVVEEQEKHEQPKKRVEVFIEDTKPSPKTINKTTHERNEVSTNNQVNHQLIDRNDRARFQEVETQRLIPENEPVKSQEPQIIDLTTEDLDVIGDEKLRRQIEAYERRKSYFEAQVKVPSERTEIPTLRNDEPEEDLEERVEHSIKRSLPLPIQLVFHLMVFVILIVIVLSLLNQLNLSPLNRLFDWIDQVLEGK